MERVIRDIDKYIENCEWCIQRRQIGIRNNRETIECMQKTKIWLDETKPQELWTMECDAKSFDGTPMVCHRGCFTTLPKLEPYYLEGFRVVQYPVDQFTIMEIANVDQRPCSCEDDHQ